jgi:predicted ArsR family transcriptional regulator
MKNRGPERTVSDERILLEILLARGPAVFSSEVAESVPLSRQQIRSRLANLEEEGFVASKSASGRRLWWLTDRGEKRVQDTARDQLS